MSSQRAGEGVLNSITRFIERKLKLKVNDQKSRVVPSSQSKFLGFSFSEGRIHWHPDVLAKFKHKVRKITGRTRGVSMDALLKELSIYLRDRWVEIHYHR